MPASEIRVGKATNSSSTPTNLQRCIDQEFVTFDVGAAGSRNFQNKDMD